MTTPSEESAERGSVAPRPQPRPFDALKLELGVVLVVAACAGLATVAMDAPGWAELLGVTAVGFGCGGWIALRTRRLARSLESANPVAGRSGGTGDDRPRGGEETR